MAQPQAQPGMTDEELLALLNSAGPPPADPGKEWVVVSQTPGVTVEVERPQEPAPLSGLESGMQAINDAVRSFARGVPILGAGADEANAATAAALAPYLEPLMRRLPNGLQDAVGYDPAKEIGDLPTYQERYEAAKAFQNLEDQRFDTEHPGLSTGLQLGGGLASGVGAVAAIPRVALPLSAGLGAEAGLIPRVAAGIGDAAIYGGPTGYASGEGGWTDPSRVRSAAEVGAVSAVLGGAIPLASKGVSSAWQATIGKARDAAAGLRNPAATDAERLADAVRSYDPYAGMPEALRPKSTRDPDAALAEILAARKEVPPAAVPPSAEDDAIARIARAMARQRQTPEEVRRVVEDLGPFGMIADSGEAMRTLTRDALNRPSGAEDIIRKALETRQRGVFDAATGQYASRPSSLRILDEAGSGLRVMTDDWHGQFDALNKIQREAADPLYAQVREIGPTYSPKLQELEQRPAVKRAMARAYRIAKEEGRNPEALGLVTVERPGAWDSDFPPDGAVRLAQPARGPAKAPTRGPSLAKFIADGGGMKDAGGDLAAADAQAWHKGKAYQKPLIGDGASADDWALKAWEAGYFPELTERPTERQLLDALRTELRGKPRFARDADPAAQQRFEARNAADEAAYRGGYEPAPRPEDYVGRPAPVDEVAYEAQPTAETWDYIKRGLDDVLETYRNKTTGELVLNDEGRAVLRTLQELRGELVHLNPVYGEALNAYSGPAAMKDALEAGRSFFREDAPALGRKLADMSSGEREMYRLGALQGLKDKLGGSDVTFDAARRAGLLKPNQLERFKELFPTEEGFRDFIRRMEAEQTMFATRSAVLGNSTTAKQLLAAQDNDEATLQQAISAGIAAKTGNPGPILTFLKTWGGSQKMGEPTAEALAAILTNMDQSALPGVTRRLDEAAAAQRLAEEIRKMSLSGGAAGAATAAQQRK